MDTTWLLACNRHQLYCSSSTTNNLPYTSLYKQQHFLLVFEYFGMYREEVAIGFSSVGCMDEACPLHLLQFAYGAGASGRKTGSIALPHERDSLGAPFLFVGT